MDEEFQDFAATGGFGGQEFGRGVRTELLESHVVGLQEVPVAGPENTRGGEIQRAAAAPIGHVEENAGLQATVVEERDGIVGANIDTRVIMNNQMRCRTVHGQLTETMHEVSMGRGVRRIGCTRPIERLAETYECDFRRSISYNILGAIQSHVM
jgi:hypothetical protein